jgi:hypothetical protein
MGNFLKKIKVKIRTEAVSMYFKIYSDFLLEILKKPMEGLRMDGHNCDLYLTQVSNR